MQAAVGRGRNASLDGLRAVAVGLVFLSHVDVDVFPGGYMGVDIFFALSGYLITGLLLAEWDRDDRIWLFGFYARRWLRLMPALVAMVLVVAATSVFFTMVTATDVGATLTYLINVKAFATGNLGGYFAHTWSLAVEEQFYLVWPFVLLLVLRRRISLRVVVVAISVLGAVITGVVYLTLARGGDVEWAERVYRLPTTHAAELGTGILLALGLRAARRSRLTLAVGHTWAFVASAVVILVVLFTLEESTDWLYLGGFLLPGIPATALVAHVVLHPESTATRLLGVTPLAWLGERSYAFYLWHFPLLAMLTSYVDSAVLRGLAGLVLSLLACHVSWVLVERPVLRRKVRYEPASRLDPQAATLD